jgi:hypothetical protein
VSVLLDIYYVLGLQSFLAFDNSELNTLAFFQVAVPFANDGGVVEDKSSPSSRSMKP